jgi:hypothetical protein
VNRFSDSAAAQHLGHFEAIPKLLQKISEVTHYSLGGEIPSKEFDLTFPPGTRMNPLQTAERVSSPPIQQAARLSFVEFHWRLGYRPAGITPPSRTDDRREIACFHPLQLDEYATFVVYG